MEETDKERERERERERVAERVCGIEKKSKRQRESGR